MSDTHGRAASSDRLLRRTAPAKAPTPPGMANRTSTFRSTLPNRQWTAPDAADVPISARGTLADARAGVRPTASSRLGEVTP